MAKRKRPNESERPEEAGEPLIVGSDLTSLVLIENLAVGRTPNQLIAKYPRLTEGVIAHTKRFTLQAANHPRKSGFAASLRIRHVMAALEPDPYVDRIEEVFANERLGCGGSLRQMNVMDNYGKDDSGRDLSNIEFERLRNEDETTAWRNIKLIDLDEYPYFSYCDAESFRFYVPARMIYALAGESLEELVRHLNPNESFPGQRDYFLMWYSLLDVRQRRVIANFLQNLLDEPSNDAIPKEQIKRALKNHWGQFV